MCLNHTKDWVNGHWLLVWETKLLLFLTYFIEQHSLYFYGGIQNCDILRRHLICSCVTKSNFFCSYIMWYIFSVSVKFDTCMCYFSIIRTLSRLQVAMETMHLSLMLIRCCVTWSQSQKSCSGHDQNRGMENN